jgi:outer membrane lipoprotein-sorting protein
MTSSERRNRGVSYAAAVLALVVLTGGASVGWAALSGGPSGDAVLDDAAAAYEEADSYAGVAAVTVANDTAERTYRAEVAYSAPDRHRVELLAPEERAGDTAATNGSVAWAYDASTGALSVREVDDAETGASDVPSVTDLVDRLQANATVERVGTETVAGEEAYVLRVTNESADGTATLWVGTDSSRVLQFRAERTDDPGTVTVRYEEFDFGVSVHESAFRPPGDAAVTTVGERESFDSFDALAAETDLALPGASVEGLTFESATLAERDGAATAMATYADGSTEAAVVVSESERRLPDNGTATTVAGTDARVTEVRDRTVVYWRTDGTTYAVTGDLPREELLTLAEAVAESTAATA